MCHPEVATEGSGARSRAAGLTSAGSFGGDLRMTLLLPSFLLWPTTLRSAAESKDLVTRAGQGTRSSLGVGADPRVGSCSTPARPTSHEMLRLRCAAVKIAAGT